MALSATEKLRIARILAKLPSIIDAQISALGAALNADREAAIREELTRWNTAGTKFVRIVPKESNKGVETNSDDVKADIKRNLSMLLEFVPAVGSRPAFGTIMVGE